MFRSSASFVLALLATSVLTAGAAPVQKQARALDLTTVCADLASVQGITSDITTALNTVAGLAGSGTTGLAGALNTVNGIVSKISTVEQTLTTACSALTGSAAASTDTAAAAAAASTDAAAAAAGNTTVAAAGNATTAATA